MVHKTIIMEKTIKLTNQAQGNKYTNAISIKGEWLKEYGFQLGDYVTVYYTKNKITITNNKKDES